jgi:hypothetical protein
MNQEYLSDNLRASTRRNPAAVGRRTIGRMVGVIGAAWPGLAQPANWDFSPLLWAVLLLLAAWVAGIRLRWWSVPVALAGGLPCSTVAAHFGLVAALAAVITVALVLRPLIRAGRSP